MYAVLITWKVCSCNSVELPHYEVEVETLFNGNKKLAWKVETSLSYTKVFVNEIFCLNKYVNQSKVIVNALQILI